MAEELEFKIIDPGTPVEDAYDPDEYEEGLLKSFLRELPQVTAEGGARYSRVNSFDPRLHPWHGLS